MIVVMPAGHTSTAGFRPPTPGAPDEFVTDFMTDLMPYAESHYRIKADRANRAIAGLSMGGNQTINIAFPHLDQFSHIGVYSSGLFELFRNRNATNAPTGPNWEQRNAAQLDSPKLKKGLKLVWFGVGKDDFLLDTSRNTVTLFKKHGFNVVDRETAGGHTWINWRDYLNEFAPQLFQ
jgi:enterochelin esterase family protein